MQLYDFGVAEDGRLYYVMELLDGLDLDTLVRQHGPLPAERVVHLLRQVCAALQDAHANGLVHRDIKPANVVVSRAGTTFDFVKVLDFGLVKLDSPRDADRDAIKLSTEDSWSGTPGYMAPEVVLGAADTDHRVDLYALGCVAYWLLTGKMVFEGENAMQVMMQHVQAEPKRPSERIGAADSGGARGAGHGVPGEGPGPASGERGGRGRPVGRGAAAIGVDRGAGGAVVGDAPAAATRRAAGGGCAPVARGAGAADRAAGAHAGLARPTTRTPVIV